LHRAEIGRGEADMGNIFDPDYRHRPNPPALRALFPGPVVPIRN
jgi:hypothetical protein